MKKLDRSTWLTIGGIGAAVGGFVLSMIGNAIAKEQQDIKIEQAVDQKITNLIADMASEAETESN